MKETLVIESSFAFEGNYPDVPLAEGVNLATFSEMDDNPMFMTLPIAHVGIKSRNGRKYNLESVQAIGDAITKRRVSGRLGHLRDEERPYTFDVPPLIWVGATLENNTLWGKAYVLPSAVGLREYIRASKIANARIGTSIYGTADVDEKGNVSDLQIESVDMAHPDRLGNPKAAAVPVISRETQEEPAREASVTVEEPINKNEGNMPDTELKVAEPVEIAELKRTHTDTVREMQGKIAEQETALKDFATICKELGNPKDAVVALREMKLLLADSRNENRSLLDTAIKQGVAEAVTVESRRAIIEEMVSAEKPSTRAEVQEAVRKVMERESVKSLLREAVAAEAGPAQTRPTNKTTPVELFPVGGN